MNKSKYNEKVKPYLQQIEIWKMDDITEKEIAYRLDVPYTRFRGYKKEHEELKIALMFNKEMANAALEYAAYKSAKGYVYKQTKQETTWNEETKQYELHETEIITKEMPSNAAMLKFLMINKMTEKYKDKQSVEHEGEISVKKLEDFIK